VVWRRLQGKVEVAVVHRPRYDDWTLPKGKVHDGESLLATAVREVAEELGARVAVSRRLSDVRYPTDSGRKTVSFWAMHFREAMPTSDDEVDDVRWLSPKQARRTLTYDLEQRVVAEFAALPPPDSVIVLVRHAKAGRRSEWRGDDVKRPLDLTGEQQALQLVPFLCAFAPEQVYSAELVRCVQTVQPLADVLGVPVQVEPAFSDVVCARSPDATVTAALALAKPGAVSVVCSQGQAIPHVVEALAPGSVSAEPRKGSAWVLSMVDGAAVSADYYDAPA
jgi:8-oxo-dGTP diphosphatase